MSLITFYPAESYSQSQKVKEQDIYVSGYLKNLFENNYNISSDAFHVCNNVVVINNYKLDSNNPEDLLNKTQIALQEIEYIKKVVLANSDQESSKICSGHSVYKTKTEKEESYTNSALPDGILFKPLMADPEWPRFTLAYQYLFQDQYSRHVFAPNFGASFSLFRINDAKYAQSWEIGIIAGLFGIMDIGSTPTALVNADYYISLPLTYRQDNFSILTRIYHLSSHLGDELMLTKEGKKLKE